MEKSFLAALLLCLPFALFAQNPGPGTCIGYLNNNQAIAIPHQSALNPTGGWTIEGWFLPTNTSMTCCGNALVRKGNLSGPNGFALETGALGDLQFRFGNGTSIQSLQSANALFLYNWNHIAATADGTTLRLYVNGMVVDSVAQGGALATNSDTLYIGNQFQGEIDEVRYWNAALDGNTIRDWMCRKLSSGHPNQNALIARWDFDDGSGTTLSDVSGNNLDGTLIGGPMWGPSSAPIGDTSIWTLSPATASLQLTGPNGDSLLVDNIVSQPQTAHLYLVNEKASATVFQNGNSQYESVDTTHYWGVFYDRGALGTSRGDVTYFYNSNPYFNQAQECESAMGTRPQANFPYWNPFIPVSKDPVNNIIYYPSFPRSEFIPAIMNNPYGLVTSPAVDSICNGDSVQLLSSYNPMATYQWFLNSNPLPNSDTNIYNATLGGTYHLTITDSQCTFTSANLPITVLPGPTVTVPGTTEVYLCDSVLGLDTLVSPAGGAFFGTGVIGTDFTTGPAGVGFHSILYLATDQFGCSNSALFTVEVMADPMPTITILANDYCEGWSPLHIPSTVMPPGGIFTGPGVVGDSLFLNLAGPGVHLLTYTVFTNSCSFTDSAGLSIVATPPPPSINWNGTVLSTNATTPTWYELIGGVPTQVSTTNPFTPPASGTFAVTNTVFPGCESDLSDSLVVVIIGIDDPEGPQPSWYPAPVRSTLTLELPTGMAWTATLFDLHGRELMQQDFDLNHQGKEQLDLSRIDQGIYLLQMTDDQGRRVTGRIVKQ